MENASKALIIAGSILLSILIIALGMYIFSQAGNSTDTSQLSALEVSAFNGKFDKFKGTQTGGQVNSLIDALVANARTNDSKSERPTVTFKYDEDDKSTLTATGSDVKKDAEGETPGTEDYISELKSMKDEVANSHRYTVKMTTSNKTDLIDNITINY